MKIAALEGKPCGSLAISHENLDCLSRGPWKYCMALNCIHNTIRGAPHLLSDDFPPRMQLCEWLHQHTATERHGASAHCGVGAAVVESDIPGKWIGRRGPLAQSPLSLDLSTVDFFLSPRDC